MATFTITSLNSWQWAQGSVYYLLGLWSRLVSSMPYLKGASPSLLEANVPKIMQAYVSSRRGIACWLPVALWSCCGRASCCHVMVQVRDFSGLSQLLGTMML